jgi:hypothetical protein
MANSCLNTFLIYAKAKTIRQILDTCRVADPKAPEEMEVSFAKILGYSPEYFGSLAEERTKALCSCYGFAYDSTFATDIPPDDDTFMEYEMTCYTWNRPPINIAVMLAYRFKCGVVLRYEEPGCHFRGEYVCHYNPHWETSPFWEENRKDDTGNVLHYLVAENDRDDGDDGDDEDTRCYEKPALNGRVIIDHSVTFPIIPCFENMGLPG